MDKDLPIKGIFGMMLAGLGGYIYLLAGDHGWNWVMVQGYMAFTFVLMTLSFIIFIFYVTLELKKKVL